MTRSHDYPSQNLSNHFLVAMPSLHDPNFSHTVIYLCEHGTDGAMGFVINDPLDIPLSQIFEQLEFSYTPRTGEQTLLSGGPVQMDRGFVLHSPGEHQWESTRPISNDIYLTSSSDIIADIAKDQGPNNLIIALGYAGWGPGQLEEELADNAWLTVSGDSDIIFHVPFHDRASAAAAKIGIDINQLSSHLGHA